MKLNIVIANKNYELDVDDARANGVLTPVITEFSVGDVFKSKSDSPHIITKPIYTYSNEEDDPTSCYGLLGLRGLEAFSNYKELFTKPGLLRFLNEGNYVIIGNINNLVANEVARLSNEFRTKFNL